MRKTLTSKFSKALKLEHISEYQQALNFFQNNKFRLSDEFFKRSLSILE